jgi:hypothetical protein
MRIRGLGIALLIFATPAFAGPGSFGAIAYDEVNDNVYVMTDLDTKDGAIAKVLAKCETENSHCQTPLWFTNGCGALARASNVSWGTGYGENQAQAANWAMRVCAQHGGRDCKVKVVMCSPGGSGYIPSK